MQTYQIIAERVQEIGITKAELARRIGIDDELLRRSLIGKRKIDANEFLVLCYELGLKFSDFNVSRHRYTEFLKKQKNLIIKGK